MIRFKHLILAIIPIFIITLSVYLSLIFVLSKVLSSDFTVLKLNDFLNKQELNLAQKGLKVKISPVLKVDIKIDKINLSNFKKEDILNAENLDLNYNILNKKTNLNSDYIYLDFSKLNSLNKPNNKKKTNKDFSFLNSIFVKKAKVVFIDYSLNFDNLKIEDKIATAKTEAYFPKLKTKIIIGKKGSLTLLKNNIIFNDLEFKIDDSNLYLSGNLNEFKIKAKNAPVGKIERLALFIMKKKNPNKKQFLENFKNFDGIFDIDLTYKSSTKSLEGAILAPVIKAKTTKFSIPLVFKNAKFEFKDGKITSKNKGKFGGENVVLELNYDNLFSPDLIVFGRVEGILTDKFNYIQDLSILGSIKMSVNFKTQHKKPDVDYFVTIFKNSDVIYKSAYFGLRNEIRHIKAFTHKENDRLKINNYSYSLLKNNTEKLILKGESEFISVKNKLKPSYVTIKTNGYAPVSITGSFNKFVEDGEFFGDLKYDFIKKQFLGDFSIVNTKYKDFIVKKAKVNADKKNIKIDSFGFYKASLFTCKLEGLNDLFNNKIKIYEMDLFLDEYVISPSKNKRKRKITRKEVLLQSKKVSKKLENKDIEVEKWVIKLNKIVKNKIKVENILIIGNYKDDIFSFDAQNAKFALGLLSAKGKYNFNTKTAKIDFSADKINSNIVAKNFFDLENQLEGIASAKMIALISDDFQNIEAHAEFQIDEGRLPLLQEKVFTFKTLKFKISDIINLKPSQIKNIKTSIDGSFDIKNKALKNVEIIAKQKILAFSINGDYNSINQKGKFDIFGKYDKDSKKGVKIFFVPISWLIKIIFRAENSYEFYKNYFDKLPSIESNEEEYFRIKLEGNLNKNLIKYEFKSVR